MSTPLSPLDIPGQPPPPLRGADIPGHPLAGVYEAYRRWLGATYDLGALDVVMATAAAERLGGDPPWLLVLGGSGAAKTETLMPLAGAGAHIASTINGEAGLLSGTSDRDKAKDATGGMLRSIGARGLLVLKDFTSVLSMNRDTRALVMAALREVYDGRWSRQVGTDGGRTLTWEGRLVVIGACTTAWDSAHQVVATMGDRFILVRLAADAGDRRRAGLQAMRNVSSEGAMRTELAEVVGKAMARVGDGEDIHLTEDEIGNVLDLADLVTRTRTGVERDFQGNPLFAHALEMPTRLAKQLVQVARGALALGKTREQAMAVVDRCARDTLPPLRLRITADVARHHQSYTADVVYRCQLPRKTVDRCLQELHLLGLLVVDQDPVYGNRWLYKLSPDIDRASLARLIDTP